MSVKRLVDAQLVPSYQTEDLNQAWANAFLNSTEENLVQLRIHYCFHFYRMISLFTGTTLPKNFISDQFAHEAFSLLRFRFNYPLKLTDINEFSLTFDLMPSGNSQVQFRPESLFESSIAELSSWKINVLYAAVFDATNFRSGFYTVLNVYLAYIMAHYRCTITENGSSEQASDNGGKLSLALKEGKVQ